MRVFFVVVVVVAPRKSAGGFVFLFSRYKSLFVVVCN